MNEIPNVLEANEKIIWDGKPKYSAFMASALIGGLIILVFFSIFFYFNKNFLFLLLGMILFSLSVVLTHLTYKVTHYAITNKRVIFQSGIIGRDFTFVDYDKVQNATVDRGLIDVLFKTGSIKIFSGKIGSKVIRIGKGSRVVTTPLYDTIKYIPNVYEVFRILQDSLSKRKESLYK